METHKNDGKEVVENKNVGGSASGEVLEATAKTANVDAIKNAAAVAVMDKEDETAETIEEAEIKPERNKVGRRGIVIDKSDGTAIAKVPRNDLKFLNVTVKNGKVDLSNHPDLLKRTDIDPNRVFQIGPSVGAEAFPGKDSANTLVQRSKNNLNKAKVIRVLKSGGPRRPAVFELLVDKWVGPPSDDEKVVAMETEKAANKAARAARKSSTTQSVATKTEHQASVRSSGKAGDRSMLLDHLKVSSYAAYRRLDQIFDQIEQSDPDIYKSLIALGSKVAA